MRDGRLICKTCVGCIGDGRVRFISSRCYWNYTLLRIVVTSASVSRGEMKQAATRDTDVSTEKRTSAKGLVEKEKLTLR